MEPIYYFMDVVRRIKFCKFELDLFGLKVFRIGILQRYTYRYNNGIIQVEYGNSRKTRIQYDRNMSKAYLFIYTKISRLLVIW